MFKIRKIWLSTSDKIRYMLIGIINAVITYLIYALFLFVFENSSYQTALIVAWLLSTVTSFILQKHFVFRQKGNILKQYLKCFITWVGAYFLNVILLEIFVKYLNFNPYLSQIVSQGLIGIFTFIVFKKAAFKANC